MRSLVTTAAAVALLVAASPALASGGGGGKGGGGGGGGGGTKPVLPVPPIPPATFDGIGPGPTYIHDSFGHAQRTRLARNGSVVDVVQDAEIAGIRAEFPNNQAETWLGTPTSGAASWKLTVTSPGDPFETVSPLEQGEFGYQDGSLSIVGAEFGAPDTRPAAVIPFAAPTGSASAVSADTVNFIGRTAIGFSDSAATNRNFETGGKAWLEVDTFGLIGGAAGPPTWTFHAGSATFTGTYTVSWTGYNRLAVSYDPVAGVARASIDDAVVATAPVSAGTIKYAGVEGSLHGNVDNFTVKAG